MSTTVATAPLTPAERLARVQHRLQELRGQRTAALGGRDAAEAGFDAGSTSTADLAAAEAHVLATEKAIARAEAEVSALEQEAASTEAAEQREAALVAMTDLAERALAAQTAFWEAREKAGAAIQAAAIKVADAQLRLSAVQRAWRSRFRDLVPGYHKLGYRNDPDLQAQMDAALEELSRRADLTAVRIRLGPMSDPVELSYDPPTPPAPPMVEALDAAVRKIQYQRAVAEG